jgi:translation initiation factor 2 gamma subunit (eIF-2gamma)
MKKETKNLLKAGTKPVNHTTQHKHEKPVCPVDYPGHQFRSLTMMSDSSISSTILTHTECSEINRNQLRLPEQKKCAQI